MNSSTIGIPRSGTPLHDIETPALLVDLPMLERNIAIAHDFFRDRPVRVRSVTKGHKCPDIARLQMTAPGAVPYGLACAKVSEAEVMVEAGARDIRMIEQVVGPLKLQRLARLARRARVAALIDDPVQVDALEAAALVADVTFDVLVEVDIGLNRCGVQPGLPAVELARTVASRRRLNFVGISGHETSAAIRDPAARLASQRERFGRLVDTRRALERHGLPVAICAGGATVAWKVAGTIDGMTEIEPGAYVLMDHGAKQGVPELEFGFALKVLATVISRPTADRAVIDCGHKMIGQGGAPGHLPLVLGPPGATMNRLNSEHGILDVTGEARGLRIGDKIELVPWYYGATIIANDRYVAMRDGQVAAVWDITARGCHQ